MKFVIITFIFLAVMIQSITGHPLSQKMKNDQVQQVKQLIEEEKTGFLTGHAEKVNSRLGDSVSDSLKVLFPRKEIYKKKNVILFLPVIKRSFLYPRLIVKEENKKPIKTIKLLKEVLKNTNDLQLRGQIFEILKWLEVEEGHFASN